MPSKYPVVETRKLIAILHKKGFYDVSQKGSHKKLSDGNHIVIVPMHEQVMKGTLKSILNQADIELDEFLSLL